MFVFFLTVHLESVFLTCPSLFLPLLHAYPGVESCRKSGGHPCRWCSAYIHLLSFFPSFFQVLNTLPWMDKPLQGVGALTPKLSWQCCNDSLFHALLRGMRGMPERAQDTSEALPLPRATFLFVNPSLEVFNSTNAWMSCVVGQRRLTMGFYSDWE